VRGAGPGYRGVLRKRDAPVEIALGPETATIRILIADEQALFREAVQLILENEPDLRVVADAGDGLQAVASAERTRPDVAMVYAHLPNCDGIRTTGLMRERVPECSVLVVDDAEDHGALVAALRAGATGYVAKTQPLVDLIAAARSVHMGYPHIPQGMLAGLLTLLLQNRAEQDEAFRLIGRLTRREREVLALLADGGDNQSIAQALVISPQTARTHIQNVLTKMRLHSRLEAAMFVRQNGLLDEVAALER
jgi:two-component system NarL family response regulator